MCHVSACETQCEAGKQDVEYNECERFFRRRAPYFILSSWVPFHTHKKNEWVFFFGIDATAVNDYYIFDIWPASESIQMVKIRWAKLFVFYSNWNVNVSVCCCDFNQSNQKHSPVFFNGIQNCLRELAFDREEKQDSHLTSAWKMNRKLIYIANILASRRRSCVRPICAFMRSERDNINVWRQVDIFLRSIFSSN